MSGAGRQPDRATDSAVRGTSWPLPRPGPAWSPRPAAGAGRVVRRRAAGRDVWCCCPGAKTRPGPRAGRGAAGSPGRTGSGWPTRTPADRATRRSKTPDRGELHQRDNWPAQGRGLHPRGLTSTAVSVALEFGCRSAGIWDAAMFHCNGWSLGPGASPRRGTHVCLPRSNADTGALTCRPVPGHHLCGAPVVLSELARAGQPAQFRGGPAGPGAVGGPAHLRRPSRRSSRWASRSRTDGLTRLRGRRWSASTRKAGRSGPPRCWPSGSAARGPTVSVADVAGG